MRLGFYITHPVHHIQLGFLPNPLFVVVFLSNLAYLLTYPVVVILIPRFQIPQHAARTTIRPRD